ncbi:DNA lesion error-prone repair protein ImuA [Tahibacter amnicola]|uniref:DNA lesion error-prone repair protein ImuA n=1 Tax=Tahibacter amnicola TaxID=2976241 RepID=A0ABY6BFE3_9GAMM|nr:DNA lesion error-prone repair protein ImuA [Tahibacter amnicola]UXI68753.1 DNA lesion error-prone repair protein ImuA [Tahibacter amnicola]
MSAAPVRSLPLEGGRSAPAAGLDGVLRHPGVWRRSAPLSMRAQSTGWDALDRLLPGGGWPLGALSEILIGADGLGELSLLMPALASLTRQKQRVVFVAPPYIPYAPALAAQGIDLAFVAEVGNPTDDPLGSMRPRVSSAAALQSAGGIAPAAMPPRAGTTTSSPAGGRRVSDASWSAEQCLRSGACGAVLFWADKTDYAQLRRWQLAAEHGGGLAFVFRPEAMASQASPSALRLLVHADEQGTSAEILKCRGSFGAAATRLRWRA